MNEINPDKNMEFREFNSDIDLVSTFRTILRGKFFILSICSITSLISIFQANRITPVWQGEVNIVMRDGEEGGNMPDLGKLSKFVKTTWLSHYLYIYNIKKYVLSFIDVKSKV